MHLASIAADIEDNVACFWRRYERRLYARRRRQILKGLFGFCCRSKFLSLYRLTDQMRGAIRGYSRTVDHEVITHRILPFGVEERPHPTTSNSVEFSQKVLGIFPVEALLRLYFLHPIFHRGNDQNLQHVTYPRKKLLARSAVINQWTLLRHFTHGRLKRDPIEAQTFHPSLPPMALCLEDLRILGFGNSIAPTGFYQDFAINASIIQNRGDFLGNLTPTAIRSVRDSYDRHNNLR